MLSGFLGKFLCKCLTFQPELIFCVNFGLKFASPTFSFSKFLSLMLSLKSGEKGFAVRKILQSLFGAHRSS